MLSFLDSGDLYVLGFIPQLLAKLTKLYNIISSLPHYRFYASSLLFIYDGVWSEEGGIKSSSLSRHNSTNSRRVPPRPQEIDVRMIDFAHFVPNAHLLISEADVGSELPPDARRVPFPPKTKGPDGGYLLGLCSLIHSLQEILADFGGNLECGVEENGHFQHVKKDALAMKSKLSDKMGVDSATGRGNDSGSNGMVISEEGMDKVPSLEVEGSSTP